MSFLNVIINVSAYIYTLNLHIYNWNRHSYINYTAWVSIFNYGSYPVKATFILCCITQLEWDATCFLLMIVLYWYGRRSANQNHWRYAYQLCWKFACNKFQHGRYLTIFWNDKHAVIRYIWWCAQLNCWPWKHGHKRIIILWRYNASFQRYWGN